MRLLGVIMIRYLLKSRDFEKLCFLHGGKCNHLDMALGRKINSYHECREVVIWEESRTVCSRLLEIYVEPVHQTEE